MAQVQLIATIIALEKLDRDQIARQIEACGKGLPKGRPHGRVRQQGQVLEGWFGGESMVAIRLQAKVVEGRLSTSRLFEILRKWRRTPPARRGRSGSRAGIRREADRDLSDGSKTLPRSSPTLRVVRPSPRNAHCIKSGAILGLCGRRSIELPLTSRYRQERKAKSGDAHAPHLRDLLFPERPAASRSRRDLEA